jgi:ABC-type Zn uptake system ZnuABC Zn-binding protein ZnuA
MRTLLATLAAVVVLPVAACGVSSADRDEKLSVVTSVAPITSIVAAVAGDRVHIEGLIPEGVNSHTFEPPPRVAEVLGQADIVFLNGLQLEDPTKGLAESNKKEQSEIVELGTRILPRQDWIFDFSFPEKDGKPNPHLWTDPTYALKYAALVRDTLTRRDPDGRAEYEKNYQKFEATVRRLDSALREDQTTIPEGSRKLLTYHDGYAYFSRTYGWKVIGAVQPKNFEDPAPSDVARLIDQVKREKVPTIFGSEVFPSTVLEEIGRATGARYEEHCWLGLMRYDFITMVRGLGGTTTALSSVSLPQTDVPDEARYPQ